MAANPEYTEQVQSNNITNRSIAEDLVLPPPGKETTNQTNHPSDGQELGKGDKEADQRAIQLKLSRSRVNMDPRDAFVNDPSATWLINNGQGLGAGVEQPTSEEVEELIQRGCGTQGIFTVIEPADLDLYRSLLPAPLQMPEHPIVGATLLDMNQGNPVNRFQEGRLTIKCLCPDGLESWLVISTPVPFNIQCREGVVWGWPKYVADQISFSREENSARAEVLYQGDERYSLDFTAGPVKDEAALKALGKVEGGNTVSWYWIQGGSVLVRTGRGPGFESGSASRTLDWQAGQVKVHIRPSDPWAGLIPEDSVTDGFYQKFIGVRRGDTILTKLATVGGRPVGERGPAYSIRIPKYFQNSSN